MVGIPIPYEQSGLGHAPELKISPLPSKLLARLHEVPDVFNHESHKKALMLALRERQMKGAFVGQTCAGCASVCVSQRNSFGYNTRAKFTAFASIVHVSVCFLLPETR